MLIEQEEFKNEAVKQSKDCKPTKPIKQLAKSTKRSQHNEQRIDENQADQHNTRNVYVWDCETYESTDICPFAVPYVISILKLDINKGTDQLDRNNV